MEFSVALVQYSTYPACFMGKVQLGQSFAIKIQKNHVFGMESLDN